MGRPSVKSERRAQIIEAFSRVLANHGFSGATIQAIAAEADVAPGLIHHHFQNKDEILSELLETLRLRFRKRVHALKGHEDPLRAYAAAAVRLDENSDRIAARCWVGLFAEAVRNPALFAKVRRMVDTEIEAIRSLSGGTLGTQDAGAILAFVIGSLVLGSFAPKKTTGFAAPSLERLIQTLLA